MPLIECPDCKKGISSFAEICVHCGRPKDLDRNKKFPPSLYFVAIIFIAGGIVGAIEMYNAAMLNRFSLNLGVFGLLIGIGLLLRIGLSRTIALFYLLLSFVWTPIAALMYLGASHPIKITLFGIEAGNNKPVGLFIMLTFFLVSVWQFSVLTSEEVKKQFEFEDKTDQ